jgi:sec-independent protein translocase protein TatC
MLFVAPGIYASIYVFVKPALLRSERRRINFMSVVVLCVFWAGIYLAHQVSMPLLLKALMGFKSLDEAPFLALSPYIDMALGVLLATALMCELPVAMFFLSRLGWVSSERWRSSRRTAIVLNAVVSAVLSPPDAVSMLVMMVPIQLLYECGVLAARMAEWKHHDSASS